MQTEAFSYERDMAPLTYFAGRICHDLNNLITSSMGAASLLEMKLRVAKINTLESEVSRLQHSINNYQIFTQRLGQLFLGTSDLKIATPFHMVLDSSCEGLSRSISIKPVSKQIMAQVDAAQMTIALKEIILNAIESSQPDGLIEVSADLVQREGRPCIHFVCKDCGKGIQPEDMPKIFTPFFSKMKRGNLVGLGLSQAGNILYQHGSVLTVHSLAGIGTTVEFFLEADLV